MSTLAERVAVLRDEVLDTAELGDSERRGEEVFDAVIRRLSATELDNTMDMRLYDAIARRLAWGDAELRVLVDAEQVCRRMMAAAVRALSSPLEEQRVVEAIAHVGSQSARATTMAAVGRAARERAARLREEAAAKQLQDALHKQREELWRYGAGPPPPRRK